MNYLETNNHLFMANNKKPDYYNLMLKFLLLILFISTNLMAKPKIKSKLKNKIKPNENFADHVHDSLSSRILVFANTIDNFFGSDRAQIEANKTRLRFYTDTFKGEGSDPITEGNMKFQLVLPKTQNRLRFVVESSEDKDEQASSKGSPGASTSTNRTTGEKLRDVTTAGFRYILDVADLKTSVGTGIKFDELSPRPFIRFRIFKDHAIEKWLFRPRQELLWVSEEGNSTDTDLNFDKELSKNWLFRIVNNMQWNDQDYIVNFQNGPSWFHKVSEKIGMSYNAHVFTASRPIYSIINYSLSIGYRQLLYKDWFFWTLSPAVNFPRVNNFHRTPSATVRFEVVLGYI